MVSRKEDVINFDKLEKDVLKAMNADAKYKRENDAKFRAVDQKVASYDEFRDIVLASHLKPLDKGESIEKVQDRYMQKWNVCAGGAENETGQKQAPDLTQAQQLPKNGLEFARDWRRHCKSDADRSDFLLRIGGDALGRLFRAEISMGLLGDMVSALEATYRREQVEQVVCILDRLSQVNRFSLSLQFLSTKETEACASLFRKIDRSFADTNADDTDASSWRKLLGCYGVEQ